MSKNKRRRASPPNRGPKSLEDTPDLFPIAPPAAEGIPAVYLRARIFHPLIYRKRLVKLDRSIKPGQWVAVYAPRATPSDQEESAAGDSEPSPDDYELWGYGLYNPKSEIALRMIRFGDRLPDSDFWSERINSAVRLRNEVLDLPSVTDAYRLTHAEGDGFPGLVVDRYADVLSAELFSWGMWQRSASFLALLAERCGTRHTIIQTAPKLLSQEGFDAPPVRSPGAPRTVEVREHGTRFRIDLSESAHKTGFFCDQRENRRRLATFCGGKSVLDLCCYSGGFSLQAKCLGNAADVTGVDLDDDPLRLARENARLNKTEIRFVQADIFPYMRDMVRQGRRYDVVVLDPPKLINARSEIEAGTRTHFDMNRLAMQLVKPGGMLLTCSCAGLLPEAEFTRLLFAAARQAGDPIDGQTNRRGPRPARLLFRSGAAPDHPVASNCPEGEYLKAAWMTFDDA